MKLAKVEISLLDTDQFHAFVERVVGFVDEYAWHKRDCAAIAGNSSCDCGYDEALATLPPSDSNWSSRRPV